jgi:hypothetical protein
MHYSAAIYSLFLKPLSTLRVCTLPNRTTMKLALILLTALLFVIEGRTQTYYFSTSGDDNNSGTTATSPFRTLVKLNTLTLSPGASVLFKCGDVFRGRIRLKDQGTAASPIIISSYGTGNKPVISGADTIKGWTLNGSIYQAIVTRPVTNFFLADKEQTLARYPNDSQYLAVDEGTLSYVKDVDIMAISPAMVNNSKICIHTSQWSWEKARVTSVAGDAINFSPSVALVTPSGYGYFLYDNILHLDTAREWKYEATTQLLSYMPVTGMPFDSASCEVTVDTIGIRITGNAAYINISGLSFEKQAITGIMIGQNNHHIKIDDCFFARQYHYGIVDSGSYNEVSNSHFREIDGIAMFATSSASNGIIHHNNFRNIGQYRNSGIGEQINLSAIKMAFASNFHIHHNNIDSTGYCGISADGTFHLVEKNIIKNAMLINNDGAALKTFGLYSRNNTFRNNFISTSDGSTVGVDSPNFHTPAIYFDFQSNNSFAIDNTIYDRKSKGIFLNSGTDTITVRGNTVYGFNFGVDMSGGPQTFTDMTGMRVTQNKLFARDTTSICLRQIDAFGNFTSLGFVDSNYYFNPYDSIYALRSAAISQKFKFPEWLATGNDSNTVINHFLWPAGIDSSKLFINPTDDVVVQDLSGYLWWDLDSNLVTSLTLQPWTSKILIRANASVLPLTLVSFTANKSNEDVRCTWQTSSEVNTSHFHVQRSLNGRDYTSIGKVIATNSNTHAEYSFTDINAQKLNAPYAYYRLEMVDKDSKTQYSPVERVVWSNTVAVSVYPNPARDQITVNGMNIKTITLFDTNGKLILHKTNCTDNNIISLQSIARGAYWLRVQYGESVAAQLVIVQ